ncbi:NAD-dependent epimerase/dehydratase family protein [Bdellovibrio bacteriovorus]|uniref:NAD-dependent epimerase/dehydratase family protein n=1 Tax=Bdellovibrio bacteriovorus TaxID=959 RepID=UPI0035A6B407
MKQLKIAVTGYSGFIGTHLVPFLIQAGHHVIQINLRTNWEQDFPLDIDCLVHLAGKAHDLHGSAAAEEFFSVNTDLTKKVYEYFLKSQGHTFLHVSSVAAVQEQTMNQVLTESTLPEPRSPYGKSKLAAEEFLLSQSGKNDKKVIILRPAMVHGAGDKGNLHLLYKIVSKGVPYPFSAFSNKRSFLSIDNFCFAVEKMLISKTIESGIYNLVDDEPISTNDIVAIIGTKLGKPVIQLKIPKMLIQALGKIGDLIKLPINSARIAKLTSDYVVSNTKIKEALGITILPVKAIDGISKTIDSFTKKKQC